MGILRDRMEADPKIGNYSPLTIERYLHSATKFAEFHMRSPAEMGRDEVREWLLHLIEVCQRSVSSVRLARAAVLFLYRVTLDRELELENIPVPRQGRRIPVVLSGSEVQLLLDQVEKPKYRALIMAMYGGGLRVSEACGLRPEHIDSKRMLLCFSNKGDKERCTLLSQRLLEHLRDYWRHERPTNGWMFPGQTKQGHISNSASPPCASRRPRTAIRSDRFGPTELALAVALVHSATRQGPHRGQLKRRGCGHPVPVEVQLAGALQAGRRSPQGEVKMQGP